MYKNCLFIPIVLIFILNSCQQSKEDRIKTYKEKCILNAKNQIDRDFARIGFLSGMDSFKAIFDCNCQCQAEKLVQHFSPREMERWDHLPNREVQQIIYPIISSCDAELEKNISEFLNKEKELQIRYMDALEKKPTSGSK